MRVSLIYPPVGQVEDNSALKAQERHLGIFPPLSLCYVASVILEAGHEVDLVDANALRLDVADVVERVRRYEPDLLAFTVFTHSFHVNLSWIRDLKARLDLPVLVGGQHVGLYPRETLSHPTIDYGLIGEAESNLPALLRALETGGHLANVPNLCFRRDGAVVINPSGPRDRNVDEIPLPARHLLPNDRYASFLTRRRNFTAMVTSRGCPFRCSFCAQRAPTRLRSPERVIEEIEQCYHELGIREIDIFDTTFTVKKSRAQEICERLTEKRLDLEWMARTRCDLVDRKLLEAMAASGCRLIMYGIESAEEEILKALSKETSMARVRDAVRWTQEAGIQTLGFFMIGSPGETHETARRTIRFARELRLDHIQCTKVTPFPGTELYEDYLARTGDDRWRRHVLDSSERGEFELLGTTLTAAEAQRYVRRMYLQFYFRPWHILRLFLGAGSIQLVLRFAVAAIDMLLSREHVAKKASRTSRAVALPLARATNEAPIPDAPADRAPTGALVPAVG